MVRTGFFKGVILAGTFFVFFAAGAAAQSINSIQLIGNFYRTSCIATDSTNFMDPIGNHTWKKLRLVGGSAGADTTEFYFTKNQGADYPYYWGWSGVWGVATYDWNPPLIATVLPDTGYYYVYFKDDDYTYWLDRPEGCIEGTVTTNGGKPGVPDGAVVTLYDSLSQAIGSFSAFNDSTFHFGHLCGSAYSISASAPGYKDTLITDLHLAESDTLWISIDLQSNVGVLVSSYYCSREEGGIDLTWSTSTCSEQVSFNVYRGATDDFGAMTRRNSSPVTGAGTFYFHDYTEDPYSDYYYYIVEVSDDKNPTRFGPILAEGLTPSAVNGLHQNFPNPFNPSTAIPYTVGTNGDGKDVTIAFYDVTGKLVERHNLGIKGKGDYTFRWNPSLSNNRPLPSGVYYCRLQIGKDVFTRKLILLR